MKYRFYNNLDGFIDYNSFSTDYKTLKDIKNAYPAIAAYCRWVKTDKFDCFKGYKVYAGYKLIGIVESVR